MGDNINNDNSVSSASMVITGVTEANSSVKNAMAVMAVMPILPIPSPNSPSPRSTISKPSPRIRIIDSRPPSPARLSGPPPLKMPNIGRARPVTSPVSISRTSAPNTKNSLVTIPMNITGLPMPAPTSIPLIRPSNVPPSPVIMLPTLPPLPRSPPAVTNITIPPPIVLPNIPTRSTLPSIPPPIILPNVPARSALPLMPPPIVLPNVPARSTLPSIPPTVLVPTSPSSPTKALILPAASVPTVPVPSSPTKTPILSSVPDVSSVISAVNQQLTMAATIAAAQPAQAPIISRNNIVPINERPSPPRDATEIVISGRLVDRTSIAPIALSTLDTDSDEELMPINVGASQVPRPPITNIPMTDITTTADDETLVRPASPTTRLAMPESLQRAAVRSPVINNDTLITPTPPVTTMSNRVGRGRGQIPSLNQPTLRQPNLRPPGESREPIRESREATREPIRTNQSSHNTSTALASQTAPQVVSSPVSHPSTTTQQSVQLYQSVASPTNVRQPVSNNTTNTVNTPATVTRLIQPNIEGPSYPPPAQVAIRVPVSSSSVQVPAITQSPIIQSPITQSSLGQPVTQLNGTQSPLGQPMTQLNGAQGPIRQPLAPPSTVQSPQGPIRQPTPLTQPSTVQSPQSPQGPIRQPVPISDIRDPGWDTPLTNKTAGVTAIVPTQQPPLMGMGPVAISPVAKLPTPVVPNYSTMTLEEQVQHRANFRTRFGILRTAWPNYYIPDVPDSMPLEQVHAQYDVYIRHIHISSSVDKYKVYLVIMWLLIELFCTKIGLKVGGYTLSQMRAMNKYEQLLIELGETKYKVDVVTGVASEQSDWPIEARIFFTALVNAVTFIIIKMVADYIGEGMADTIVNAIASYVTGSTAQPGQVLFGGPQQPNTVTNTGSAPMPDMNGPGGMLAGLNIPAMIANFGSSMIAGRGPTMPQAAQPTQATNIPQAATPGGRFRPAYDE